MAVLNDNLQRWKDSIRENLPGGVLSFFEGGSRRELLKQVDSRVLLFDGQLINLATGASADINTSINADAEELALACSTVLGGKQDATVLLLLHPGDFVATSITLPGLSREALVSALRLQAETLLPSLEEKLAVAVNPATAASAQSRHVALWITETRLNQLFEAFEQQGLFLAAVMPRNLLLLQNSGAQTIQEADAQTITRITGENGSLSEWLFVDKSDLEQELFLQQWQRTVEQSTDASAINIEDQSSYQVADSAVISKEYCFFPPGALNAERRMEKGKRLIAAGIAAAVLVLLGASPYLLQSFTYGRLASGLESAREFSAGPRADRSIVQQFEDVWGPINDFPDQNIREALFTLQNILSPDRLSSFEVTEGVIKIEGESSEPQAILQRLEQDPLFTEVAFSRATSNSRYYIDLRLSAVNFEGYMVRYFPDN